MDIISILFTLVVFLALAYVATMKLFTPKLMAAVFLGVTVLLGMSGVMPGLLFWPAVLLFGGIVVLMYSPGAQQKLLWTRLFSYLKSHTPPISRTEQIAADAGGVWWEQELFSGAPDWQKLFSLPRYEFTPAERDFLKNEVVELCALIDQSVIDKEKGVPKEIWSHIKSKGFLALVIPEEYGGKGFSHRMHAEVVSRLAVCSSAVAVTVMVPNSLGPAELIIKYGTAGQRKQYLAPLAAGKEIPCFGLTSKTAGSDANGIEDSGVLCKGEWQGEEVLGLRLNWSKRYITLAPLATLIGLAVKVSDPDGLLPESHHLSGGKDLGITCVLVPADLDGVSSGRRHNPMNVYFHNGPIEGEDVFVPLDFIIGGAEMIGEGWRMLMECLSVGRCISLPALSVAASQLALSSSSAYSYSRTQFGWPIAKFDAIAEQNALIALNTVAATAVGSMATDVLDNDKTSAVMSAMAKLYTTEALRDSVGRAMDIHAGRAVMAGGRNYLDEIYRSIPVAITVEGANILLRGLMIFGQGMLRCHPYLRREIDLIGAKESLDGEVARLFEAHASHLARNFLRAVSSTWSAGLLSPPVSDMAPKKPQRQISALSAQMATTVELCLMIYGGALKRREMVSGHLAQAWTELFTACAVLRMQRNLGEEQRISQVCEVAVRRCQFEAQRHLLAVVDNLPLNRLLRALVRWTLYPAWSRIGEPGEAELLSVNEALADPEGLRRILCDRVFQVLDNNAENHPLQAVERAMLAFSQLEMLRSHLPAHLSKGALGEGLNAILDDPAAQEALGEEGIAQWRQHTETILAAMEVDDFDKKLS